MIWDALLQVAGSWSRFWRRPAYWRFLTCLMQLRGRHRVDGVRRPKFDFHTDLDVQLDALPPRHDVDVGDVGLIEFLGMRAPEEDRVVAEREGASQKSNRCCADKYPWRNVFSVRVVNPRSR